MFTMGKTVFRYAYLGVALYIVYGVYLTNSRGALLGLFGLSGVWFYKRYGVKLAVFVASISLPAVYFVMSMFRQIDSEEASAAGRLDAWYEGFQMLFSSPIWGIGMGQFVEEHGLTAHNSFVLVWSELGLLGYYLWVTFFVCSWMNVYSLWNDKRIEAIPKLREESIIAKALSFSLIGFLITACFLSRSFSPILYLFCGMCLASQLRGSRLAHDVCDFYAEKYTKFVWLAFIGSFLTIFLIVKVLV
jgi:O-antigen ligase